MRLNYFLVLLLTLFLIPFSSASFALTHSYGNEDIVLEPGDSYDAEVLVFNVLPGGDDINIDVKVVAGSDVASVVEEPPYFIEYGGQLRVPLSIEIPRSAEIGDFYDIVMTFSEVPGESGGTVDFGFAVDANIRVNVGDVSNSPSVISEGQLEKLNERSEELGIISGGSVWIFAVVVLSVLAFGIVIAITRVIHVRRSNQTRMVTRQAFASIKGI